MQNRTPGHIAYTAHAFSLALETGIGTPIFWRSLPEHEVKVWEATAQAVREQLETEQAKSNDAFRQLKHFFNPTPVEALIEIREAIEEFHALPPTSLDHLEEEKDELICLIGKVLDHEARATPAHERHRADTED